MCRELRGKQALTLVLRNAHRITLQAYTKTESEDDFSDMLDPPNIQREWILYFSLYFSVLVIY